MTSYRTHISQRFFAKNLLSLAVAGIFVTLPSVGTASQWAYSEPDGGSNEHTLTAGFNDEALDNGTAVGAINITNGNLTIKSLPDSRHWAWPAFDPDISVEGNVTIGDDTIDRWKFGNMTVGGNVSIHHFANFEKGLLNVAGNVTTVGHVALFEGDNTSNINKIGGHLETGALAVLEGKVLEVGSATITNAFESGGELRANGNVSIGDVYDMSRLTVTGGNVTLGTGEGKQDPYSFANIKDITVTDGNLLSHIGMGYGDNAGGTLIVTVAPSTTHTPETGNLTVRGNLNYDTISVSNAMDVTGNVVAADSLAVGGPLTVTGDVTSTFGPIEVGGPLKVTGKVSARNIVAEGPVNIAGEVRTQSLALYSDATFGSNVFLGREGPGPEYGFVTIGGNTSVAGNLVRLGGFQFAEGLAPGNYTFKVDGNIEAAQSLEFTDAPDKTSFDIHVGGNVESTGIVDAGNLTVGKDLKVVAPVMGDQPGLVGITGELHVGGNMSAETVAVHGGTIGGRLSATSLTVENAPLVIKGETVADTTIDLDRNAITALTLNMAGQSSIAGGLTVNELNILNGTVLTVDDLTLTGEESVIHVGKSTDTVGGAKLIATNLDLMGGQLILDPDYSLTDTQAAFGSLTGTGHIVVGQNSQLTLGDTDTRWLDDAVNTHTNNAGLTAGGMTAALGIKGDVRIPTGYSITVDGSVTSGTPPTSATPDSISFKPGSLTVVDCTPGSEGTIGFVDGSGNAVPGTLNIETGAKLHLAGAQPGANVQLFDPASMNAGGSAWQEVTTDNSLVQIESFDPSTGSVVVAGSASGSGMPHLSKGLADILVNATNAGTLAANAFAKNALDTSPGRHNARTGAAALEGAARMAALAAVPQVTLLTSEAVADIVIDQVRREGMKPAGVGAQMKPDQSLWAAPLYRKAKADGMKAGAFFYDWDADLTGIVVGGDATFTPTLRFGWQFNAGQASAKADGDFMKTENDADFWGLGLYANWKALDTLDVTADIGLTMLDSDIDQAVVPTVGRALKAGVDSRAVTIGLRADRRFDTAYGQFTPYAALRYTDLHTDGFGVMQGAAVIAAESVDQRLWTFPIGVALTKHFATHDGWSVTPKIDAALIATAGDTDAESRVRLTGLDGTAALDTEIADDLTGAVKVGLTVGKDNFTVGFDYAARVGSDTRAHRVSAAVNWLF